MGYKSIIESLSISQLIYLVVVFFTAFLMFRIIKGSTFFKVVVGFIILIGVDHFTSLFMGRYFYLTDEYRGTYYFRMALKSFAVLGMVLSQLIKVPLFSPIKKIMDRQDEKERKRKQYIERRNQARVDHREKLRRQKLEYVRLKQEQKEEERKLKEAENERKRIELASKSNSLRDRELELEEAEKYRQRKAYYAYIDKLKKLEKKAEILGLQNEVHKYKSMVADYQRRLAGLG